MEKLLKNKILRYLEDRFSSQETTWKGFSCIEKKQVETSQRRVRISLNSST
jgi:hypothetical protein